MRGKQAPGFQVICGECGADITDVERHPCWDMRPAWQRQEEEQ